MAQVTEQVEALVEPLLEDLGFELVDLEYMRETRGWVLRFYLDKEGGINLDDCASASREISTLLDVEDLIPTAFNLEVSSPGLERPLKKLVDFERFSGQLVKIKTWQGIDPDESGKKRKAFTARLLGVDGNDIVIKEEERKNATEMKIALDQISKANLHFEF